MKKRISRPFSYTKGVIIVKNIVTMDWLNNHLHNGDVRIIDCRFELGNPNAGREAYEENHIPNAIHFDLEKDLSGEVKEHGGRHPLPDLNEFAHKLSQAGIDEHVTVIAYDDQGGMFASRLWWMLKYVGHDRVYILEDTFSNWQQHGYPVVKEHPVIENKDFKQNVQHHMLASVEEVRKRKEKTILLDSRSNDRYLGENEMIDKKAGHIPGAKNSFWQDVLRKDGSWKATKDLKEMFTYIKPTEEVMVYCGSGVSACPNIIALSEIGVENVQLYVGSWSDWISYDDNEIEILPRS